MRNWYCEFLPRDYHLSYWPIQFIVDVLQISICNDIDNAVSAFRKKGMIIKMNRITEGPLNLGSL